MSHEVKKSEQPSFEELRKRDAYALACLIYDMFWEDKIKKSAPVSASTSQT